MQQNKNPWRDWKKKQDLKFVTVLTFYLVMWSVTRAQNGSRGCEFSPPPPPPPPPLYLSGDETGWTHSLDLIGELTQDRQHPELIPENL